MNVRFHSKFIKDVGKLPIDLKQELEQLIQLLETSKSLREIPNVKKLKGGQEAYRIRLSGYRVCFYYDRQTIDLARVLLRKDVYKYFP
jgi:mRNA interferase RelE/StbE